METIVTILEDVTALGSWGTGAAILATGQAIASAGYDENDGPGTALSVPSLP